MKLKIVILLFLFIGLPLLNAHDNSSDAIEFSVGGGVKVGFLFSYIKFIGDNLSNNYQDYILGISAGISLPISFVYYFNNNFGFGVNYKIMCNYNQTFTLSYYTNYIISIDNYLSIVNKIGNNIEGKFLLLEYGLITSGKFILFNSYNKFYVGPSLFIGYERRENTNLLYSFGGTFDAQFNSMRTMIQSASNSYTGTISDVQFNFGIEARFRFCYLQGKKQYLD